MAIMCTGHLNLVNNYIIRRRPKSAANRNACYKPAPMSEVHAVRMFDILKGLVFNLSDWLIPSPFGVMASTYWSTLLVSRHTCRNSFSLNVCCDVSKICKKEYVIDNQFLETICLATVIAAQCRLSAQLNLIET